MKTPCCEKAAEQACTNFTNLKDQLSVADTGFSLLLLPELSSQAAKAALESGTFFAASHCLGNPDELFEIAQALLAFYGADHETYQNVIAAANAMTQRIADITSGKLNADEDIGITYSVLDNNGNTTVDTFPTIQSITVDDGENTIGVANKNALLVRLISNGKTLDTLPADNAVFDLDDYAASLGDYVRIEVFGEGGILYLQPFLLGAQKNAAENKNAKVTKGCFADLGIFDFVIAEAHKWLRIAKLWFQVQTGTIARNTADIFS